MPRLHTQRRKFLLKKREYLICARVAAENAIHLKLAESRRSTSEIHVSLDTAAELCDALADYDAYYHDYRPLPDHDTVLKRSSIVTEDGTYLLELHVRKQRQCFTITHDKQRRTRSPPHVLTFLNMKGFRQVLAEVVDQLSREYLPLLYYRADSVTKVMRGNRVAVLYCPVRPWPWGRSDQTEKLLFEPVLVRMILNKQEPAALQDYCAEHYKSLVEDAAEAAGDGRMQPVLDVFKCLSVRWVRKGAEFRVDRPERPSRVVLLHEDRWFTA